MRSATSALLIFLLWAAPPQAAAQKGKSSIEGVVRSGDNSPIAGAHVTLVPRNDDSSDEGLVAATGFPEELAVGSTLSTTTDDDGKFAFAEIDSNERYRMVIRANGYVRQEFGQVTFPGTGQTIILKPGQILKDIRISLIRTGSIEGTVRAVSGEPLQDVRIRLLRYVFNRDGRRLLQMVGSTKTNDLGKYRLYFLTPGRYFLHAERIDLHADYSTLSSAAPFGPAFYPGESEISHASTIDIQPGMNRSGMDFSLSGDRLFRIRGRITNGRTGNANEELLELIDLSADAIPGGDGGFSNSLFKETYSEDTGEFEFRDIPPGRYEIVSSSFPNDDSGVKVVQVDGNVENLEFAYGPMLTLSGTVRVEGRLDLSDIEFAIRRIPSAPENENESITSQNYSNRTFTFRDITSGEYRLDLRNSTFPENSYIKEARYGGIDALNQALPITTSESRKLEIVIAPSGTVEGRLVNNKLVPLSGVMVVLVPDRQRTRADLFKMDVAGGNGHFEMHGIAPGDYKVFAWEAIEPYSWFDPEVIGKFETSGQSVHVPESSTQSVEVKLIPFER